MANHKTGSQRYNDRMDKIFDRAKSEGRGLVGDSGLKGYGVNSKAMMEQKKKIASKMVKVLGHSVREGSKKHKRLLSDKKHYDDLGRSEH